MADLHADNRRFRHQLRKTAVGRHHVKVLSFFLLLNQVVIPFNSRETNLNKRSNLILQTIKQIQQETNSVYILRLQYFSHKSFEGTFTRTFAFPFNSRWSYVRRYEVQDFETWLLFSTGNFLGAHRLEMYCSFSDN